jgi:hypothetical protein
MRSNKESPVKTGITIGTFKYSRIFDKLAYVLSQADYINEILLSTIQYFLFRYYISHELIHLHWCDYILVCEVVVRVFDGFFQ